MEILKSKTNLLMVRRGDRETVIRQFEVELVMEKEELTQLFQKIYPKASQIPVDLANDFEYKSKSGTTQLLFSKNDQDKYCVKGCMSEAVDQFVSQIHRS